ncbi:MAG: 6-bladed beta-propeller [Gemmatimonadota bacterium]
MSPRNQVARRRGFPRSRPGARRGALLVAGTVSVVGLWTACGGDASPGAWAGEVRDSAGVELVLNPARGVWTDADRWRVTEELRIGEAGGDPAYQFGQIAGIGVVSDGRIFVLDQQAQNVRVFSEDGIHLSTLGGPGSGPGQLALGAGPLLVARGDTLLVPDLQNRRVTRFAPDGTFAGSFVMDLREGIPARWEDRPSGRIAEQVRPLDLPNLPAADSMDSILEREPDGSIRDTLFRMRSGGTFSFAGGAPEFHFFVAEPLWALYGETGLLFGVNDGYRVEVHGVPGRVDRIFVMPFERTALTEEDREVFLGALERAWKEAGVPPPALENLVAGVDFAPTFPAYFQFLAGPAGTIWVQRLQAPAQLTEEERDNFNPLLGLGAREWDVFDPEGRYLGVVAMPTRFQPLRFREDRVYGIWRDELDVQYVMVLRIDSSPGA